MPCSAAYAARPGRKPWRGHDEAALAGDRLDDDRGDVVGADLLVDLGDHLGERLGAGVVRAGRPAERVGQRHPVDLARERAEALLVGHVLRGHGHREVGAAVVAVLEHHDGVALGVDAGDLDRVLEGLGAGVEQRRLLGEVTGGEPVERLAHLDVALVRRDHEAGVREGGHLVLDVADHVVGGVADADHGDAGAEVDEGVAVDVDEHPAARPLDEHRQRRAEPAGDRGVAALEQLDGARPRDRGDDAAFLGERGAAGGRGEGQS